jgi:hypothetical protein
VTKCCRCGKRRVRLAREKPSDVRTDGYARTVWLDDKGRRWNGRECPDCHGWYANVRRSARSGWRIPEPRQ